MLHRNAVRRHGNAWAHHTHDTIMLPHTVTDVCVEKSLTTRHDGTFSASDNLLSALRDRGVNTVFVGPAPEAWTRETRTDSWPPPDPRTALSTHGIARCSLHPHEREPSASTGPYDDDTVREACTALEDAAHTDQDTLLWVSLWGTHAVSRVQFRRRPDNALGIHVDASKTVYDRKHLPTGLYAHIEGISPPLTAHASGTRIAEREYATLLSMAKSLADDHADRILRIVAAAETHFSEAVRVVYTSSHSYSIGEYGVRGGDLPTGLCCNTFFCSNGPDPIDASSTWDACVFNMISGTFSLRFFPPPSQLCTRLTGGRVRYVVARNHHAYAMVFDDASLL